MKPKVDVEDDERMNTDEPNWPLPEYHRLVIFIAGKLAERDRRWRRRVSWVDRLDAAKEIMDEWHAITRRSPAPKPLAAYRLTALGLDLTDLDSETLTRELPVPEVVAWLLEKGATIETVDEPGYWQGEDGFVAPGQYLVFKLDPDITLIL